MTKYKTERYDAGSVVVVRPDLNYSIGNVASDMMKYAGQIAKIKAKGSGHYIIDIDNERWAWQDHMFIDADIDENDLFEMYVNKEISAEAYAKLRERG